jgi:hypothetical protein
MPVQLHIRIKTSQWIGDYGVASELELHSNRFLGFFKDEEFCEYLSEPSASEGLFDM